MARIGNLFRTSGSLASAALIVTTPVDGANIDVMPRAPMAFADAPDGPIGALSVLTYNVHGLPDVLRKSDVGPLSEISERLRDMRREGQQPAIVVLQEVFTAEARRIGTESGYRHVVRGPDIDQPGDFTRFGDVTELDRSTYWLAGEGLGKQVDSGLLLLSDYPIVRVRRMAFPDNACAGFDCLANKGVLLATVQLPGNAGLLDVATTHFNSRGSAGVSHERSLVAFRRQSSALLHWLKRQRRGDRPLVLAGDFNIGKSQPRRTALFDRLVRTGERSRLRDALSGCRLPADAREARRRAKDWQFWSDGSELALKPVRVDVPFGHEPDGTMLSDHIGYAVRYQLVPAAKRSVS